MHDHAGGVDDMAQVRGGELGRRGGDAGGDALEPLVDGLCVELPRNDATADLLEIRVDGTGKNSRLRPLVPTNAATSGCSRTRSTAGNLRSTSAAACLLFDALLRCAAMMDRPALPPLSEDDAALLETLQPDLARLLYPDQSTEPFTITAVYPELGGDADQSARELEASATEHTIVQTDDAPRASLHHTTFSLDQIEEFHELYHLAEAAIGADRLEVLLNGRTVPLTPRVVASFDLDIAPVMRRWQSSPYSTSNDLSSYSTTRYRN